MIINHHVRACFFFSDWTFQIVLVHQSALDCLHFILQGGIAMDEAEVTVSVSQHQDSKKKGSQDHQTTLQVHTQSYNALPTSHS